MLPSVTTDTEFCLLGGTQTLMEVRRTRLLPRDPVTSEVGCAEAEYRLTDDARRDKTL